ADVDGVELPQAGGERLAGEALPERTRKHVREDRQHAGAPDWAVAFAHSVYRPSLPGLTWLDPGIHPLRKKVWRRRWIAGSSPAMTPLQLFIAPWASLAVDRCRSARPRHRPPAPPSR